MSKRTYYTAIRKGPEDEDIEQGLEVTINAAFAVLSGGRLDPFLKQSVEDVRSDKWLVADDVPDARLVRVTVEEVAE